MKLTVLGSGTSVPHAKRSSPGFWLESRGTNILLDASADVLHRMAQENVDWPNLDVIWISHFHLDHMAGLFPLLFGFRWAPQVQMRNKSLRIIGPEGLTHRVCALNNAGTYNLTEQKFPVYFEEVQPGRNFEMAAGVQATTLSTPHTNESMALRLSQQNNKSLVYTSDTSFSDDLIRFASGVDLLVLECSFRRNKPLQRHLELAEAMQIAVSCNPGKLLLTHFYPEWDEFDLVSEASNLWPGETIEATDGLTVFV